jgi:hypothetical protein
MQPFYLQSRRNYFFAGAAGAAASAAGAAASFFSAAFLAGFLAFLTFFAGAFSAAAGASALGASALGASAAKAKPAKATVAIRVAIIFFICTSPFVGLDGFTNSRSHANSDKKIICQQNQATNLFSSFLMSHSADKHTAYRVKDARF